MELLVLGTGSLRRQPVGRRLRQLRDSTVSQDKKAPISWIRAHEGSGEHNRRVLVHTDLDQCLEVAKLPARAGCAIMMSEASPNAAAARDSPSAAMILPAFRVLLPPDAP